MLKNGSLIDDVALMYWPFTVGSVLNFIAVCIRHKEKALIIKRSSPFMEFMAVHSVTVVIVR